MRVYIIAAGIVLGLIGIALQLNFAATDTLTPRDFVAFLVTLAGTGVGAVGAVLSRETDDGWDAAHAEDAWDNSPGHGGAP